MKFNCLIIIIIGLAVVFTFIASAMGAQISVDPEYQEVQKGDDITVNIIVDPQESEVSLVSYTLHFDNELLKATSQVKGEFFNQDSNVICNDFNNTIGEVRFSELRFSPDGVTNAGLVTTISFNVIGSEGISPLGISRLGGELLYSTDSKDLSATVNNGTCKIENGMVELTSKSSKSNEKPTSDKETQTAASIPAATFSQTPTVPSISLTETEIATQNSTAIGHLSEEKSKESNTISGFQAVFALIGIFTTLILLRKK